SDSATLAISVLSVNDPPLGQDNTVCTPEDVPYVFGLSDFGFSDPSDSPPNAFKDVLVLHMPQAGSLLLQGSAVSDGQSVSAADIAAGKLTFASAANANGMGYASWAFVVQDDGGTQRGGIDLDQ